jgi:ketosteroid isomerase-like protein
MSDQPNRNLEVIRRFYEAFNEHDGETMAACYAPEATFEDPVFGELTGVQAGNMWRLLTGRSTDLRVELAEHEAVGDRGSARWVARYTFRPTKRPVTNVISSSFRFEAGRIVEQVDRFSFYRWATQALPFVGIALGWSPVMRLAMRRRARQDLARFTDRRGGGPPKTAKSE